MLKSCFTIILVLLLSLTPCCSGQDLIEAVVAVGAASENGIHELFQKLRTKSKVQNEEGIQKFVQRVTQDIFSGESKKNFTSKQIEGSWKPQLGAPAASHIAVDHSTPIYHASNITLDARVKLISESRRDARGKPFSEFSLDAELVVATICVKRGKKRRFKVRRMECQSRAVLNNVNITKILDMKTISTIVTNLESEIGIYIGKSWHRLLIESTNFKADGQISGMSSLGEMLRAAWVHKLLPTEVSPTEAEEAFRKRIAEN